MVKGTRTKAWSHKKQPGAANPVEIDCGKGHIIWRKRGKAPRCPYCKGLKVYKYGLEKPKGDVPRPPEPEPQVVPGEEK